MKVCVIGTGYVGLVTGAIFSIQGHKVTCVDIDRQKIANLRQGLLPIYEPCLEEIIQTGRRSDCLDFTTNAAAAAHDAEVIFLAVGTPQDETGGATLTYLEAAAESIARIANEEALVVIKSTVPVGTNRRIEHLIENKRGCYLEVANNPEFLKEGTAIDDCLRPDRIVLGVRSDRAEDILRRLYAPLLASSGCELLVMEPESAEMTKYVANCFLAMKISFINEMANLCEGLGADIEEVRSGICTDRRIGWEFLKPGAGYGGSCFPKDVRALIRQAKKIGSDTGLLHTIDEANLRQKTVVSAKIHRHFSGGLDGKKIAVWGLAFKPGTDDIREAPAIELVDSLLKWGATVSVHDPQAIEHFRTLYGSRIQYHYDKLAALEGCDALVLMTDWPEYLAADAQQIGLHLNTPVLFDGRNCLDRSAFAQANFDYYSIGQRQIQSNPVWANSNRNLALATP